MGWLFDWIEERIIDAQVAVELFVDDVKSFFRIGESSYSGELHEAIDVEQVLNKFKDDIAGKVDKLQKESLRNVMSGFSDFANQYKNDFPDLVEKLESRKKAIEDSLENIIIDYIRERLSISDPDFQHVLEMQPGTEKKKKLAEYTEKFLEEGRNAFYEKLQVEIGTLHHDIEADFSTRLTEQQQRCDEKQEEYNKILADIQDGQLDLRSLEQQHILFADAEACVTHLFEQVEDKT